MVCLGRITAEERLDSGKYNIVLTGVHRAVVVEELHTELPYRLGRLELYRDFYSKEPLVDHDDRRDAFLRAWVCGRAAQNCNSDKFTKRHC